MFQNELTLNELQLAVSDSKKLRTDFSTIGKNQRFSCSGPQIVILTMPLCSEVSSYIRKLLSDFSYDQNFFRKNFLKKICSENRLFLALFEPFTNDLTTSLFRKTENFSFFIDKNLQGRRMNILKLGKDSPESGEHPRYPESMSGVPRKDFLTNFQKSFFFEKAFFFPPKYVQKKSFFEKI